MFITQSGGQWCSYSSVSYFDQMCLYGSLLSLNPSLVSSTYLLKQPSYFLHMCMWVCVHNLVSTYTWRFLGLADFVYYQVSIKWYNFILPYGWRRLLCLVYISYFWSIVCWWLPLLRYFQENDWLSSSYCTSHHPHHIISDFFLPETQVKQTLMLNHNSITTLPLIHPLCFSVRIQWILLEFCLQPSLCPQ